MDGRNSRSLAGILLGCALALCALPARATNSTRIVVESVRVNGALLGDRGPEIRYGAPGRIEIRVSCDPPRSDALYRFQADWMGGWSATSSEPVLRLDSPPAGLGRVLITAASSSAAWETDTLGLSLSADARGAAALPPKRAESRWVPRVVAVAAGALLAVALSVWWSRRGSRRARRGIPRGAIVVLDAEDGPAGATARGGAAGAQVASRRPPGEEITVGDPRWKELEEELGHLRGRIHDLLGKTRDLKRINWDLQEKCAFLEKSNEELRDLQRRKEEVMAALAHDIKNPVGAIQTLAEILQSYDLSAQDQQKMVADILSVSARIIKLSQDMTDAMVSEVRTLPMELDIQPIGPLVEEACKMNQVIANRKNVRIRTVLPSDLKDIEMDSSRIVEVLDNLISNAVKYSRPDSEVVVEVKSTASHCTIDVADQGAGLSQADVDQAFQLGKSLSTQPTAGENSSGVGLWIVRKIVEAHRGLVWVRSAPGKGSTFSIMIPARQNKSVKQD